MKRISIILGCSVLFLITVVGYAQALTGYNYYCSINFYNSGASQTSGRFAVTINADGLVDGGYTTGEDVAITSGGAEESITTKDLTNTSATWLTDYLTIGPHQSINKTLWMGNDSASRDQAWIGMSGDSVTVADAASLDIIDDLTISSDIYLPSLPASQQNIVYKDGAYRFSVNSSNWIFNVWRSGLSGTLRPNAVGTYSNQTPAPVVSNYLNVDDVTPDMTSTFNHVNASAALDTYHLTDDVVPSDAYINNVTVYAYVYSNASSGNYLQLYTKYSGSTAALPGTPITLPANWSLQSATFPTAPTGAAWSTAYLNNLEAGTYINSTIGGYYIYVTQVYVVVNYSTQYEVTTPASAGDWYNVQCHYDTSDSGAEIRIRVDDGSWSTASGGGAINTTSANISLAAISAKLDNTIIDNNGTPALQLEYEPDEISSTIITDLSSSGNNASYTLAGNPGSVSISVGGVVPYITAQVGSTEDIGDGYELVDEIPDAPAGYYVPTESDFDNLPFCGIVNPFLDMMNIDRAFGWFTLITMLAIGLGLLVYAKTHHMVGEFVGVLIPICFFATAIMFDWWIVIIYITWATVLLFSERSYELT